MWSFMAWDGAFEDGAALAREVLRLRFADAQPNAVNTVIAEPEPSLIETAPGDVVAGTISTPIR